MLFRIDLKVRHLTNQLATFAFPLAFCSGILLIPTPGFTAPGDADDDGIPDAIEAEIDIDNDGIADFLFLTEPFFSENFGTGEQTSSPYTNYEYHAGDNIQDGQYAVIDPGTRTEFWMTNFGNIVEDFTPGDVAGRAFGVNGAFEPGEFYRREMTGIVAGANYLFSAWIINTQPTAAILPNVRFSIVDSNGNELAVYESGDIAGNDWIQGTMVFESPDGNNVTLILANNAPGGVGNDLLLDNIEFQVGFRDFDGDGTPDYLDRDSDNDGIGDDIEGLTDSDGDGLPDSIDLDSDNGGTLDQDESNDSDSSGVNGGNGSSGDSSVSGSSSESGGNGSSSESDGNGSSDEGGDSGSPDVDESSLSNESDEETGSETNSNESDVIESSPIDSDSDGVPDFIEIEGAVELDMDGDGLANHLDLDSDNDGIRDSFESAVIDGASLGENGLIINPLDSDGDGRFDMFDRDSDNDGIPDAVETLGLSSDSNLDGVIDNYTDADLNGHDDIVELLQLVFPDTDLDGLADHLDTDSDNDGLPDTKEAGWGDSNGDGLIDNTADADNDGLADLVPEVFGLLAAPVLPDSDGNGVPDFRQGPALLAFADAVIGVGLEGKGCSIATGWSIASTEKSDRYDPLLGIMLITAVGVIRVRREINKA